MTTISLTSANFETLATSPAIEALVINGSTPTAAAVTPVVQGIDAALAADAAANTSGTTALSPPDNFAFYDASVDVGSTTPGDAFKGASSVSGINSQFIDLTPDNLKIAALQVDTFMKSGSGNDVLSAVGGRNILDGGSGGNVFTSGDLMVSGGTTLASVDTFISDASSASAASEIFNFHSGDDAVITGLTLSDFQYTAKDTLTGLEIDAVPTASGKPAAAMVLAGYSTADLGSKLVLGFSSTSTGTSYMFVHHT